MQSNWIAGAAKKQCICVVRVLFLQFLDAGINISVSFFLLLGRERG